MDKLETLWLSMGIANMEWGQALMMSVGVLLIYLAIAKKFEPLLLLPIGFGAILSNIPVAGIAGPDGLLGMIYSIGIETGVFPLLIFMGVGALTDFSALIARPSTLLLGAAAQFGIFATLIGAIALNLVPGFDFTLADASAIAIIGGADGPTAIFLASRLAPDLLGAIAVAAYSYMALVPIIQPPIMRALTTDRERRIRMPELKNSVSPAARLVFPIVATVITGLIAPKGLPLMGAIMLGNFLRECGVVSRLVKASQNEILSITTLFLGLAIGATMAAENFLRLSTLAIFGLGFFAICLDTVAGVTFGKLMCLFSGGRINPLLGAAGISAYPMAARVVQVEGQKHDRQNHLLMHAMGANTGGQIGSVAAAAVMLALVHSLAGN